MEWPSWRMMNKYDAAAQLKVEYNRNELRVL